jgi:hypothetical protein
MLIINEGVIDSEAVYQLDESDRNPKKHQIL